MFVLVERVFCDVLFDGRGQRFHEVFVDVVDEEYERERDGHRAEEPDDLAHRAIYFT